MLELSGQALTLSEICDVAYKHMTVSLSAHALDKMRLSRQAIDEILHSDRAVYGVNTGFGKLSDIRIPYEKLDQLQLNLVRSHACGVGEPLSVPETRAMLLLRANVLAKGHSGARVEVAEALLDLLNKGVTPVVPSRGSVGASGDLAPLSHLALTLIGEGEAIFEDQRLPSNAALALADLKPITLKAKEGLALLNGTQAMTAVGGLCIAEANLLLEIADVAGAMSLEALLGTPVALDQRIQSVRPHKGQAEVATHLLDLLRNSEIRDSHIEGDPRVQDAYSLRCMPQVHGAVRDCLRHVQSILETEAGSATDNPLVFVGDNGNAEVLSGGNFHGAPISYALDYAAIALTDLMSISERRIDRLVNPDLSEGLPPFLCREPGTSSGFMIAHVTAAALLNEAKVLAHPSSVDSVSTSGGKEDHVSMGMTGANKLKRIVELLAGVLTIELLAAAEGLEYRKPLNPGLGVQAAYDWVRGMSLRLKEDRSLSGEIERLSSRLSECPT